jgi:hypothetical protein
MKQLSIVDLDFCENQVFSQNEEKLAGGLGEYSSGYASGYTSGYNVIGKTVSAGVNAGAAGASAAAVSDIGITYTSVFTQVKV